MEVYRPQDGWRRAINGDQFFFFFFYARMYTNISTWSCIQFITMILFVVATNLLARVYRSRRRWRQNLRLTGRYWRRGLEPQKAYSSRPGRILLPFLKESIARLPFPPHLEVFLFLNFPILPFALAPFFLFPVWLLFQSLERKVFFCLQTKTRRREVIALPTLYYYKRHKRICLHKQYRAMHFHHCCCYCWFYVYLYCLWR